MKPADADPWLVALRGRHACSERSWWTTFWLSAVLGVFGADRFYLGFSVLGTLKFLSLGGWFLWWFVDLLLLLTGQLRDVEGRVVARQ